MGKLRFLKNVSVAVSQVMEFDWNEKTQGLVLSSFFWGYVVTQMPGGMFADKYGGKATLGLGMLLSSIGTIITPFVARTYGPAALIVLRVVIGLAQVKTHLYSSNNYETHVVVVRLTM